MLNLAIPVIIPPWSIYDRKVLATHTIIIEHDKTSSHILCRNCVNVMHALDGPRRRKKTIHESIKVSCNFIGIFRPRYDLDVQFSEPFFHNPHTDESFYHLLIK